MNQLQNQLYKEFEKEVWLYLDRDLPDEKMKFWDDQLEKTPELYRIIEDYKIVSQNTQNLLSADISDDQFNEMVNRTIAQKSIVFRIRDIFKNSLSGESEFSFGKIAFASALIIAAVLISFLSNKPNPVINMTNSINNEIMEWDADFVDDQINKVGTLLKVATDDDYRKYYKYKLNSNNVDKNLNLINSNIKTLKEEINSKNL